MPTLIPLLLAFFAGCVIPLQTSANAHMRKFMEHPLHASLINFLVGTVLLLATCLIWTRSLPKLSGALQAPAWAWLGGACGATFVLISVITTPKLGPLVFILAALSGQVVIGAVVDHYGLFANATRAITPARLVGIALILCGVFLVQRRA